MNRQKRKCLTVVGGAGGAYWDWKRKNLPHASEKVYTQNCAGCGNQLSNPKTADHAAMSLCRDDCCSDECFTLALFRWPVSGRTVRSVCRGGILDDGL